MDKSRLPINWYTEKRESVKIIYKCIDCKTPNIKYQPYPENPQNTDHRQYCWWCKKISNHKQLLPPKKEL